MLPVFYSFMDLFRGCSIAFRLVSDAGTGSVAWDFSAEALAMQGLQAFLSKIAEILEHQGLQSFFP